MWRAAAVWVFLALSAPGQDTTAVIQGVVTDSATKLPVAGVQISLTPAGAATDLFTDASGSFRVAGLAPGQYGLRAQRSGYRESFRFVELKTASSVERITLGMTPLSDVSGGVFDEDGRPMPGVLVYMGTAAGETSGADGTFRIRDRPPGEYRLRFVLSASLRQDTLQRDLKTGEAFGYASNVYYPGVSDPQIANAIPVGPGMHVQGLDVRLKRGRLVEITGRVLDVAGGAPLTRASVELEAPAEFESWRRDNQMLRRLVDRNGAFRFDLLPPGRYSLLVYRDGAVDLKNPPYVIPLNVGNGGLTDAEFRIPPNVSITVRFVVPHPEVPVQGGVVIIPARHGVGP